MDVTLYMGQNFDFITFPEEYTTGSSIMPHKKNPDVFELIRAKCNRIKTLAFETDIVITNLPSGYHRDYQVLKENLIPAFGDIRTCLHLAEKVLLRVSIRKDILEDQAYRYIGSVDRVNQLVAGGVPFRDAYQTVAQQIRNKTFTAEKRFEHTHEGSIGRLCLDEIQDKMKERIKAFGFEKTDKALKLLTEDQS
jgi:argininosuccinate lyase